MGDVIQLFPKNPFDDDKERQKKLEEIKQRIAKGECKIDTEKLAEKILESGVLDD